MVPALKEELLQKSEGEWTLSDSETIKLIIKVLAEISFLPASLDMDLLLACGGTSGQSGAKWLVRECGP